MKKVGLGLMVLVAAVALWKVPAHAEWIDPIERIILRCDYTERYSPLTISSFVVSVKQEAGTTKDPTTAASIVSSVLSPSGLHADVILEPKGYCNAAPATACLASSSCAAGDVCRSREGKRYIVTFLATLSDGQKIACPAFLTVSKATWQ
jgi:hypothetical protein